MPTSTFTLLVVDDEPNIAVSLKETRSSLQLVVISAGTAREGIDLIRQKRPDVVILDVRLGVSRMTLRSKRRSLGMIQEKSESAEGAA